MITLIPSPLQERCRLSVGPRHDQTRYIHDIKLEAGSVQPLDLLIHADKHLAPWCPHLFVPGF